MTAGPATANDLNELHRALVRVLIERVQDDPSVSAELLQVARRTCRDNGLLGLACSDADRKRLQRLYRMYVQRMEEALAAPDPSAALLGEVRVFLSLQGVGKDLSGAIDTVQALQVLGSAALPFN